MERVPSKDSPHKANNKRKSSSLGGLSSRHAEFPRKRSATACQLCRTRKTKCDNNRPICSKCGELGAECIYQDQPPVEPPASHILQRLEYLIALVEPGVLNNQRESSLPMSFGIPFRPLDNSNSILQSSSLPNLIDEVDSTAESAALPSQAPPPECFGSSEDALAWPIFEAKPDRRWIDALIFDPTLPSEDLSTTPPTSPRVNDDSIRNTFEDPRQISHSSPDIRTQDIREQDVPRLIEAFLVNVHVKNPIFDPDYLRNMAKSVVEHGFDWDASNCLILTVCALAAISSQFEPLPILQDRWQNVTTDIDNSLSNTTGYLLAEAYYVASRKRIGLLRDTLLATECHFMSGVYEMYSLRPLQAAISFNRACVTFQTLTWMRTECYITQSQLGKARASRLYWSCLKSEHEVSIEIHFPSSGLTKLNYTSAFPPPPSAADTEDWYRLHTDVNAESPQSIHSTWTKNEFEHGWYYYLADIAARRLLQRVIEFFYRTSESAWLELSFAHLVNTAEELDRQLGEWEVHRALPGVISFDVDTGSNHELVYHLQARALEIKERIYRPFLYRMIHRLDTFTPAERNAHQPLVTQHAITCTQLIRQWNVRHRHHGTWLMSRQSFASALFLLAARKAGIISIPFEQFQESILSSIATLQYWEREAPDLKASRQILENIYHQVHSQVH